jgi:hypothetical protein
MLTGRERYRQVKAKARIMNARNLRHFMEGKIDVLPCSMDVEADLIRKEFERMRAEIEAVMAGVRRIR